MRCAIVAMASLAVCTFAASIGAVAQHWRIPDGYDNATPRYYDYRAPRAYYPDEAPAALRLDGPVVVAPPAAVVPRPTCATGSALCPDRRQSAASRVPATGIRYAAPLTPYPAANIRPICGVYRFWSGDRCIDARGD